MIKFYFFLLCPLIGFTQPVLTHNITPIFGAQYDAQFIDNPNFNPGPEGANQTWDFSSLQGQFEIHFNILDPADTPETDEFPDASFVWNIVEFESFFYYKNTDESISQMGTAVASDTETTFLVINTELEEALQFPITFGTTYDYHTEYDNYLFGSLLNSGQRDATLTADGYGTIITPYGTHENALRIKIVTTEFNINSTQYAWFDENSFIPILVYETSEDPEENPSLYFTDIDQVLSAHEEINFNSNVFYSDVSNSVIIRSLSNSVKIKDLVLYDRNGSLIQQNEGTVINGNENEYEFVLQNNLSAGIYFLKFVENDFLRTVSLYIGQ